MNFGKLSELLKNSDISLAIGLVFIVAMMVLPLPPAILDILLIDYNMNIDESLH